MSRPKGSKNKKKVAEVIIEGDNTIRAELAKKEIPPPTTNGTEDKNPCVNCEPDCEGKGMARWHYGSKDKMCNKCKCMFLKQ